ncbi:Fic family protein [Vogesella sp. XCS3]|uniref:Fic family protein n=1 Tax=Vogesella sp. XCS3 TaxID=2877939 RepID=UPI00351CE5B8
MDNDRNILFPITVTLDNTPVGHLEFALRHEGVNLEVIDALFEVLEPQLLIERLRQTPTGEYIRRSCAIWEWLKGKELNAGVPPSGNYVELFPSDMYAVAANPTRIRTYRVTNNALGTPLFCPIVLKSAVPTSPSLEELLGEVDTMFQDQTNTDLYNRAIRYLYLSETRSSFAIERETANASKEEMFVRLLEMAGETEGISEERLVELQNTVVRDPFAKEMSYRSSQNWLTNSTGRITFLPPTPDDLLPLMDGWEEFVCDNTRGVDLLVKTACAAFGFVYNHPFMDGNGRLHRFMIHQLLAQSDILPEGVPIPVSAVIMKHIPEYLNVLEGFSKSTTALWDYRRGELEPHITRTPGIRPYRFWDASRETAFLGKMIAEAVQNEIPRELSYLQGYDAAFTQLDAALDIPHKDLAILIRATQQNGGTISNNVRKRYYHIPGEVLDKIEAVVRSSFADLPTIPVLEESAIAAQPTSRPIRLEP